MAASAQENELKAILFDVDGTIADTERHGHLVAFNMAFEEEGLDWHWSDEMYHDLLSVTGGKERMHHYIQKYNIAEPNVPDLDAYIAKLHARKTELYVELLDKGGIPLRPGIKRLLEEARKQGIRLAISTTTSPDNVDALFRNTLGIKTSDWFECIAAGDMVKFKKPAPDVYLYALNEMQLTPQQCIAIEDSVNGIVSATGAGLKSVITVNDYTKDENFDDAAIVLDHMGEPDMPFTVLQGDAKGASYLDVNLIRQLHEAND